MSHKFPYFSHLTFRQETGLELDHFVNPSGPSEWKLKGKVCRPSWPGKDSGVTIGAGYDMKLRTPASVVRDLTDAHVDAELARRLSDGAAKRGDSAQAWCDKHQDLQLSTDCVLLLFENIYYSSYVSTTKAAINGRVLDNRRQKYYEGHWEELTPIVQEVLVDLHYRGDLLLNYSREKLGDAIKSSDLTAIRQAICDVDYWQKNANLKPDNGKPNPRHLARRDFIRREATTSVSLPMRLKAGRNKEDTVTAYYHYTETNRRGGFFPIGQYNNLHGGVHIERNDAMGAGLVPVRCLGPGYIVALRMTEAFPTSAEEPRTSQDARAKGAERNREAARIAANNNGFVLVRHEISKQNDNADSLVLYSLYMHLVPPRWTSGSDDVAVPWIETIGHVFGTFQIIDPDPKLKDFRKLRWTTKSLGQMGKPKLLLRGEVPLFGHNLHRLDKYQFGPPESDPRLVSAVWKPPTRDLIAVHDALLEGRVVTFHQPYLKVQQGEALGFASIRSGVGNGFIHWEILTPSTPSGVERLLGLAETLGIERSFFVKFEEQKASNNYFEDDELTDLANAVRNTFRDESPSPDARRILDLLRSDPGSVPFVKPDNARRDDPGHFFPITFKFENFNNHLPGSTYAVRVSYDTAYGPREQEVSVTVADNGTIEPLTLFLPADVKSVTFTPVGFHLEPGKPSTKEDDVEHFKRLAMVRWRNVWLRHLNEWSMPGMERCLKIRQQMGELPPSELKPAVDSMAWWATPDTLPAPLDGAGAEEVFGKMLPEACQLDNPHPITAAWLLELLHKHDIAHFRDPKELAAPPCKASHFGWMPALSPQPKRRVGEVATAVVVEEGIHDGGSVELVVKSGRHELKVSGQSQYSQGLFSCNVGLDFWGDWTLGVVGQFPEPEAFGAATMPVATPVLQAGPGLSAPVLKGSLLKWRLTFSENCPVELKGFVMLKTARHGVEAPPGSFQKAPVAIPMIASRSNTAAGIRFRCGFMEQGPAKLDARVTQHFTMKDFYSASSSRHQQYKASRVPKLAERLLDAVQGIRARSGPFSLKNLDDKGLSVVIIGQSTAKLNEAISAYNAAAPPHLKVTSKMNESPPGLEITVSAPSASDELSGGECLVDVNLVAAFSKLATGLGKDEVLDVKLGLLFPNGAQYLPPWPKDAHLGESYVEMATVDSVRNAAPDCVEAWSENVVATLRGVPSFGKPRFAISGRFLVITVDLIGGNARFWSAAQPQLISNGKSLGAAVVGSPQVLQAKARLSDPNIRGTIRTKAQAAKKGVLFNEQLVNVSDSEEATYENVEKLLSLSGDIKLMDGYVEITATFQATPTDKPFVFALFAEGGERLAVPITYKNSITRGRNVFGCCDEQHVIIGFCLLDSLDDLGSHAPGVGALTVKVFEPATPQTPEKMVPNGEARIRSDYIDVRTATK